MENLTEREKELLEIIKRSGTIFLGVLVACIVLA